MQPEDLFTIDTMIFMFVFTFLFKGLLEYNACIYYRGSNRNVYIIFVPPFMSQAVLNLHKTVEGCSEAKL